MGRERNVAKDRLREVLGGTRNSDGLEMRDVVNFCFLYPAVLIAMLQVAHADGSRFWIDGDSLFFNSNIPYPGGSETDIVDKDADELGLYVMEELNLKVVILESWGGNEASALRMATTILEFGLATEVRGNCESACPLIFLAGRPRTISVGGQIGFHRSSATPLDIRDFTLKWKEEHGESLPFREIVYDDSITSGVTTSRYMLNHGVSEEFVLKTLGIPPREMLRPTRAELVTAGIIHED